MLLQEVWLAIAWIREVCHYPVCQPVFTCMHLGYQTDGMTWTIGKQSVLASSLVSYKIYASLLLPVLQIAVLFAIPTGCDAALLYDSMTFTPALPLPLLQLQYIRYTKIRLSS